MEKIIAIFCSCDRKIKFSEYPDYKSSKYENCVFTKLNVFDGEKTTHYELDKLKDIGFLFEKNVTLIAFNAYFHFSLLFHHIDKQNLNFDLGQCGATCCVTDLCKLTNQDLPKYTLPTAIDKFKECIQLVNNNIILRELSSFWICHGGERSKKGGKWLLFANKNKLQSIWEVVIKNHNTIKYDMARVSTMAVNIWGGKKETGVVEIFISGKDFEKIGKIVADSCNSVLKESNVEHIFYKTNKQTERGTRFNGVKKNSLMKLKIS